jgi:hypothetical protein
VMISHKKSDGWSRKHMISSKSDFGRVSSDLAHETAGRRDDQISMTPARSFQSSHALARIQISLERKHAWVSA